MEKNSNIIGLIGALVLGYCIYSLSGTISYLVNSSDITSLAVVGLALVLAGILFDVQKNRSLIHTAVLETIGLTCLLVYISLISDDNFIWDNVYYLIVLVGTGMVFLNLIITLNNRSVWINNE